MGPHRGAGAVEHRGLWGRLPPSFSENLQVFHQSHMKTRPITIHCPQILSFQYIAPPPLILRAFTGPDLYIICFPLGSIEVKEKVQLLQSSMKNGNATNGVCSSCSCPVPPEATTVIPAKVNIAVDFLFHNLP